MKKILLGMVLGVGGVYAYQHLTRPASIVAASGTESPSVETGESGPERPDESPAPPANPEFHCDGRIYCSQMKSCEEATFFLNNCPGVKMDGEGDGVPCERQWCGSH